MPRKELTVHKVAEAYLALLAERGVAKAGTDFAPLVEAFAKAAPTGRQCRRTVSRLIEMHSEECIANRPRD
jgi:predicted ATPase